MATIAVIPKHTNTGKRRSSIAMTSTPSLRSEVTSYLDFMRPGAGTALLLPTEASVQVRLAIPESPMTGLP
jgi:hypothetical protein